jgi:diguanylate cyclase (GGDEF)-like protein
MSNIQFDKDTEKLYLHSRNTSSIPLARFGALAAICIYFITALLEAYVFLAIDRHNSPWFLTTSITASTILLLYALTFTAYFSTRLDTIVILSAIVLTCQHSFYFSYYLIYPAFSFAFSQAIVINLLAIIAPSFTTILRSGFIVLLLPLVLNALFDLGQIILFETYYFLVMCVAVTALISRLLEKINREAFLLKQELQLDKKLMEDLANKDPLTNCFNRRYFNQIGEMEYQRSIRFGHPLSLIMIDIDHFKVINDKYGHPAGDIIISAIAKNCLNSIRTIDTFARFGGEEFAILVPESDLESAQLLAERLRKKIETLDFDINNNTRAKVTISLGVANLTASDSNLSNLISRADEALYQAKKAGRNKVAVK